MPHEAPVVYGKYQLLELIARGGMAEVFKAKSYGVEGFEKILVIKRILPELSRNPQFVEMFINEAKIAVTLSHANVVQVFDLGRADARYFIAMEYVAGLDLATVLRLGRENKKPISPELVAYVGSEVAKGLDYAHRRRDAHLAPLNIVHRDVSPQNVLLSYEGEVKLTDFGIAKARTIVEGSTEHGVLKGKYAYMAPEQAEGNDVDPRTDLFALGTVLYEALAGQNPFGAGSAYETIQRVRTGIVPSLREVAPHVSDELAGIVSRAMSRDPSARQENAGRLYEELIQYLYSSGRHVGAHDLAKYLEDARAPTLGRPRRRRDTQRLRATFEAEPGDSDSQAIARTMVEVPTTVHTKTPRRNPNASTVTRPRAERRDVTALAIGVAPDDALNESLLRPIWTRAGGTLVAQDRTVEDGGERRSYVVLFGLKEPDGRDTESAAVTSLRMGRQAEALALEGAASTVQMGLHAGRVLVDLTGELIRDELYERLVSRARSLAQSARIGRTLLTIAAEPLLRRTFHVHEEREAGEGVFLLGAPRTAREAFGKFVGRREELRRLGEIFALASRGQQRVIGISGEPGTGKSRLLLETRRRLEKGGHDVGMYIAACAQQDKSVPLSAVQEMLRVVVGVDEFESATAIVKKVDRLRELGLNSVERRAVAHLLGVGASELGGGIEAIRAAFARGATKLAEDRLTIFAWDSAESMDEQSQDLLCQMLRVDAGLPICVVLTYRPGFEHRLRELPSYAAVDVAALSDDEVARLTATRLDVEEVPMDLLRTVTAKSGGNPLYVEQYLDALRAAGALEVQGSAVRYEPDVAAVEVPKTLRGIVSSRVSRLTPLERSLLQIASVAGSRITAGLLQHVSGELEPDVAAALENLAKAGIVVRHGAAEYAFAHDLLREVVHDGLTLESRADLHGQVAEALVTLYPKNLDEMAERLAHHYRMAGDRARAIDFLTRAAKRLELEQALEGALSNLRGAVQMILQSQPPDHDRVLELYHRIGELSFRSRDLEGGAEHMAAAIELARELGRTVDMARFSMMRGRLLAEAHRFSEGGKWLEHSLALARNEGDQELLRDVTLSSAETYARDGEYARAVALLDEALALSRTTKDEDAQIRCLLSLGLAHAGSGAREQALAALAEARALAGSRPSRHVEVQLYKSEGLVHHFIGDHRRTLELSMRALELAKEYGMPYETAVASHNVGESHLRLSDYKRAFASLRYSYDVAREHGFTSLLYANMRVLGFIDAMKFGSREGRTRIINACQYAEANGDIWELVQAKYMLAMVDQREAHLDPSRPDSARLDAARNGLREVLRLATEHGHRQYETVAEQALAALERDEEIPLLA